MTKNKIILIAILCIFGIIYISMYKNTETYTIDTNLNATSTRTSVENFVRQNISKLSEEKEVLGGKFFVTKIELNDGSGVVEYEDGHNAFVADFKYDVNTKGEISVLSFKVR